MSPSAKKTKAAARSRKTGATRSSKSATKTNVSAKKAVRKKPAAKKASARKSVAKKASTKKKAAPARKTATAKKAAVKKKTPVKKKAAPARKAAPAGKAKSARTKKPKLDISLPKFRRLLEAKHKDLVHSYAVAKGNTRSTESDGTEDYIDYAVSSYDRDFMLSLTEMERGQLVLVEEALKRIERREFGRCLNCGTAIPERRLEVEPWARYCLPCQELEEQGLLDDRMHDAGFDDEEDVAVIADDDDDETSTDKESADDDDDTVEVGAEDDDDDDDDDDDFAG